MRSANKKIMLLAICGSLASCSALNKGQTVSEPAALNTTGSAILDDTSVLGDPYMIAGVVYTPQDSPTYDDVGFARIATTDKPELATANGGASNLSGAWAAHRTLPIPSYVEVTMLDSGRTILVRVNDRGPMSGEGIIELSPMAAKQLGIESQESTAVRVRRVNPPEQEKAVLRTGGMATERLETPESLLKVLRGKIANRQQSAAPDLKPELIDSGKSKIKAGENTEIAASKVPVKIKQTPEATSNPVNHLNDGYIVQLAAFADQKRAEAMAQKYGATVSLDRARHLYRVRMGPYAKRRDAETTLTSIKARGIAQAQILRN